MKTGTRQLLPIVFVLSFGAALGVFILNTDRSQATREEAAHADEHAPRPTTAAEEAHGLRRLHMTDAQLARSGIEVLTAEPVRLRSALSLIGEIRFNEDRMVHVVPRLSGVVQAVAAGAGDRVSKGQLLATISSQALSDQRSELLAARKRLTLAHAGFAREKKLWEARISAEQDYLKARSELQEAEIAVDNAAQKLSSLGGERWQGKALTRYDLLAPIDGVVIEKHIALGEAIKDDASVFVIADLSTVWAEMAIYAKDLNAVRPGQSATVKATAFDAESSGTVSYVGPLLGEQTRTAKARLVLPNPDGAWRPGLPVTVEVTTHEFEAPIAVSVEALQTLDESTVVFVRHEEAFEPRPVRVGRSDGRWVEILSGLRAGERYAARDSFLVKAELAKADASHEH